MKILVECYPDTALLRALGVPRKQLGHERCKGEIVKRLLKSGSGMGVIDQAPASQQPRDLANYLEEEAAEGLSLRLRQGSGQRLIVLCPRLEDWLIQRAKASGLKLEDYGLSSDPDRLHSIPHYEHKSGFHRVVAELVNRSDKGISLLRQWVGQGLGQPRLR